MTPPLVMVVEDNSITRKVMRLLLEVEGYGVVEAADGRTAIDRATAHLPALIIQDMRLPDLHGYDLVERLRALPGGDEVPIIAVTGFLPERDPRNARFTDVLIKPVEPSRLLERIKALLATQSSPVPAGQRALVADDDPVQRKLIRLHLTGLGYQVTEAADGAAALEAARAETPDVIVTDLLMPVLDGMSLCLAVRQDPALAEVPLVLVSSYHLDEVDLDLATRSGANAVVSRTPDMAELIDVLGRLGDARPEPGGDGAATSAQVVRLIGQLKREADVRAALAESQAIVAGLLPFFERFAELGSSGDVEATIDHLLSGYLDASGAAIGCAFLTSERGGLVLRSQLGYPSASIAELSTFFGRVDLLDRALDAGRPIELPSAGLEGPAIDDLLRRAHAASVLLVPLRNGDERLGVLVLGSDRPASTIERVRVADAARGPIAQALALSRSVSQLVVSRQAFRGIVDSASDAIVVADAAGAITYANPAALEVFGFTADELVGRAIGVLVPFVEAGAATRTGTGFRIDGATFPVALTTTSFEDSPGHHLHAHVVRDLSVSATLDELAALANRDGLTGLFNRRRFDEHLAERIAESIRYKFSGALVLVDLDGFKAINDRHGHQAGDRVLQVVAERLRDGTRGSDFVARLGGDELALELPHIHLDDAIAVATKLLASVRDPIDWNGSSLEVGMSAGIAMYPEDGRTVDQVIAAADAALYRSKRAGRNRVSVAENARTAS